MRSLERPPNVLDDIIDIHCHILPGIDDGAQTLDESIAMAELAVMTGAKITIATPHVDMSSRANVCGMIAQKVSQLQSELDNRSIPLQIIHGAEVYPTSLLAREIESGAPITIGANGKYILLDTPHNGVPVGFDQLVFELQAIGITPILAHPERSQPVQEDPSTLESYVMRGGLIQSNAGSIVGTHGDIAQKTVQMLIAHGWVNFIASDAHSTDRRRSKLAEARNQLIGEIGEERVRELFIENPGRVCAGEAVITNPAAYSPPKKRTWFGRLLSKDQYDGASCCG